MKIIAIVSVLSMLGSCATVGAPSSQPRAPEQSSTKGYSATTLPDGGIEIVVTDRAGFPTGSQVAVINLKEKLEAAAAKECPNGYHLTDISSGIDVAPNG